MGVQRNCKRNLVGLHRGMRSAFSAEQFNNEVLRLYSATERTRQQN